MSKKFTLRKKIMSCISALAFLGSANLSSNISWAMEQPPAQPLPCNDINTYKNFLNQKLGGNHNVMYTENDQGLTNDAPIIMNAASTLYPNAGGPLNNREDLKESLHTLPCGAIITRDGVPFLVDQSDVGNPKCSQTVGDILVPGFDHDNSPFLLVRSADFNITNQNYEWLPLTISPLPRLTQDFPGCYVDQQGKAFASNGTKLVWNEDSSDILEDDGNGVQVEIKYPDLFGIPVKTPPPDGDQPNHQPPNKEQPVEKKKEKKEDNANKWSTRKKVLVFGGIPAGLLAIGGATAITIHAVKQRRQNNNSVGTLTTRTNQYDWKSGPSTASTGKTTQTSSVNKRTTKRSPSAGTNKRNLQRRVGLTKKNGTKGKTLVRARSASARRRTH